MIIHPELRALRGDDAPQRQAQQVLSDSAAAWRSSPKVKAVLDDLSGFGENRALAAYDALARLFDQHDTGANEFVSEIVSSLLAALQQAPLGHVPMRHFSDGVLSTLLLARSGNVTLSLTALDGASLRKQPATKAVRFGPMETWERVLAGSAKVQIVDCSGTTTSGTQSVFQSQELSIGTGAVTYRDEMHRAQIAMDVQGVLVTLRMQRRVKSAEPAREYELATGALVHQAASNSQDSRHELMLALLGRMGRQDAAPIMAEMAREAGSSALRWQSLRECLALNTGAGFAALSAIAALPDDPLMTTATQLRGKLMEAYPQLKELDLCPA